MLDWTATREVRIMLLIPPPLPTPPQSGQLIRTLRSRKLFITTLTELKAMAALARTGLSINPVKGYKAPAARGIPITL